MRKSYSVMTEGLGRLVYDNADALGGGKVRTRDSRDIGMYV